MSISDRLDQIEERCAEADEGPWYAESRNLDDPYSSTTVYNVFYNGDTADRDLVAEVAYDNAEFIAHARTDVPWLIEQVRKRDAALRAVLDRHKPMTIYEHEDCCENDSDDHREERHAEDVVHGGEFFCMDLPTGIVLCAECSRDLDFDGRDWPCPTVRVVQAVLGEEEGDE